MKEKILSVTRMPNRLMRCGRIRGNIEPPTAVPEFRCQNKSQYAKEIMAYKYNIPANIMPFAIPRRWTNHSDMKDMHGANDSAVSPRIKPNPSGGGIVEDAYNHQ